MAKIDILLKPINKFMHQENTSGIILFFSVILAIVWANSPWKETYDHIWEMNFSINFGSSSISKSLHHWINDGLMAIFFFVIGLELKREFMAGELSSPQKAALPVIAALGGMLVPAVIYTFINYGEPSISGWGIPTATDIAFAIGLLTLAGKKVPISAKVFLTALAVADDLGAVVVIALFYSSDVSIVNLGTAFAFLAILFAGNLMGIRSTLFYVVVGILGLWLAFLTSGIHPTLAGVLLAFAIPARTKIDEQVYLNTTKDLLDKFAKEIPANSTLTTPEQHQIIEDIKKVCTDAETPLQKLETALHPWVAFLIMPLFAFANSGIHLNTEVLSELINPITIGIAAGLIIGKFLGVFFSTRLIVATGLAPMPENCNWKHIAGVSLLAGVGFTMSMFVSELAFNEDIMIDKAKYGILFGSVISGISGIVFLKKVS